MKFYETLLQKARRSARGRRREREEMMRRLGRGPKRPSRKKPPEAGIAVPAEPPKGPLPKLGGAEVPLEFD